MKLKRLLFQFAKLAPDTASSSSAPEPEGSWLNQVISLVSHILRAYTTCTGFRVVVFRRDGWGKGAFPPPRIEKKGNKGKKRKELEKERQIGNNTPLTG